MWHYNGVVKEDASPSAPLRVNGVPRPWRPEYRLQELLEELEATGLGVAIERNGEVVRRAQLEQVVLAPGDRIEVVRLVGGG